MPKRYSNLLDEDIDIGVKSSVGIPWIPSHLLGGNNWGGGGHFSKVKRLVRTWIGTLKMILSGFSRFSPYPCKILAMQTFFSRHVLPIQPNMHIWPCSWTLEFKQIVFRTCFGPLTVDSVEVFRHFAFLRHGCRYATFLIAPQSCFFAPTNCIVWGASLMLIKQLAALSPEMLPGFDGIPLYHCYTLAFVHALGACC